MKCALFWPYHFCIQVVPVKASFVEYIVQECPEGVTERGTCQRLTVETETEVLNTEGKQDYISAQQNTLY